jgi:hypothetical protein
MGAELGRISGPLLTNNLLRNGVNLSFQNTDVSVPVLQLDVNTSRIGINSSSPTRDLLVGTYSKTTNLIVDTSSVFQNFTLLTNSISHASDLINIRPNQASNPTVVVPALKATNILINNNDISNVLTDTNIELSPVTGGRVITNGGVFVTGTVHATGNITWDGDITLGNADTDNITFNSDINSSIVPDDDNFWKLGTDPATGGKRWSRLYTELVHSGNMIADSLTSANNLNPVRLVGNTRYVSVNGNDTLAGNHAHAPYRTIRAALTAALSGEEIVIFPGTYTEIFPLTVPQGVSVRGTGIRSVTVRPTAGTQTNDCFLLNGESTVEFLTVANYYYNLSTNTGYAFRFANGMTVTTRSPYVHQITVLTQDSGVLKAGRGALLDGAQASSSSVQATMLFHSVTFITKDADGLVMTNGVRCEWLNSFTYFAYRGIYLTQGTVPSGSLNFSSSSYLSLSAAQTIGTQAFTFECFFYTASNGLQTILGASSSSGMSIWLFGDGVNPLTTIQIDRSNVDAAQYSVSPITMNAWHHIAVTRDSSNNMSVFLDGVKATGSVSNTANYTGPSGLIGAVAGSAYFFTGYLAQIKLDVGSNYYDPTAASIAVPTAVLTTSANTKLLLTTATSGAYLTDTSGTQTISNVGGVTYNTATPFIVRTGAELRSINSATVYGTYGVVGDGANVLAYLVGHNFGYIGAGLDSRNDTSNVIQANEIVRSNGANIYYTSDDQSGDFRVGDVFTIRQDTGAVIIVAQAVNFTNGGSISLAGAGNTYIDSQIVQTGNINIHDNNIDSVSGPINFFAANGSTTWNTNVFVTGNVDVTGNFSVDGNITVGNQALDTVSIIPRLGQTIEPDLTDAFSLGSSSGAKWRNVYINGSFDVANTFAAGSWDILTGYFEVPNIKIDGNILSVTQADTDLNLQANGSGGVNLDVIKFVDTTISNNYVGATTDFDKSIVLSPNGTGNLYIDKTNYLTLPIGSNSTRTMSNNGEIRFNSATTLFEGYQTSGLVSFKDLYDSDRNTYITAEETPGTNDNIIRFGVNGTVVGTVDSTKLYSNTIHAGNVRISGNNVDNVSSATDLNIKTKRAGGNYTGVTLTRVVGTGATFNITIESGQYKPGINVAVNPGVGYDVGTIVILPGFYLSGINPDNNCYVRVISVNGTGGITNAQVFSGTPAGTDGLYENNTQVGVMSGSGATFDIAWAVDATAYTMTLNSAGTGYRTSERYKILGTQLGGTTPQNDIIFVVNTSSTSISAVASIQQGIPFSPSTGDINVNNIKLRDMTINMPATGFLSLNTLEDGYVRFASNGLVIPKGTTAQRRISPDVGELRYNTNLEYAEIYNGIFWQPVKGSQPELGVEDLLDIMELWTLSLG